MAYIRMVVNDLNYRCFLIVDVDFQNCDPRYGTSGVDLHSFPLLRLSVIAPAPCVFAGTKCDSFRCLEP